MQTIFKTVYQDHPAYVEVAQTIEQLCYLYKQQPVVSLTYGQLAVLLDLPQFVAQIQPFIDLVKKYQPNVIEIRRDVFQCEDGERLMSLDQHDDIVPAQVNGRTVVPEDVDTTEFDSTVSNYAYVATTYYIVNPFYNHDGE